MDLILSLFTIFLLFFVLSGRCSDKNDFPEGFTFGSATSAYQWEGAFDEDGRKPSVWDTFLHSRKLSNGDITCDGYHKYKEDVKPKGLQFYKNFIQELELNHMSLFHYDHPQYLEDDYGGWINRKIIQDFTAYADVCFREFGHHVKFWTTINEANVFTIGGYNDGVTPPGRCSSPGRNCSSGNSSTEPYIVGHNLLLAHASASRLYKQKYKDMQRGSIGFSLFALGFTPSTSSKDDDSAIQRAKDFYFGWMLEPLIFGDYPDEMKRIVGSRLPVFSKEESEQVKGSSDFVGIIHYLAASVTNIKIRPSISGNPDFYSDMGVSMTFLGNFSAFEVRVSRLPNSDAKLL